MVLFWDISIESVVMNGKARHHNASRTWQRRYGRVSFICLERIPMSLRYAEFRRMPSGNP
jgi:hypothetical protein